MLTERLDSTNGGCGGCGAQGLEEKRWTQVGEMITRAGGVVTAEQLAPYLEGWPNRDPDSFAADESFVVEVLQR